jgi:hypothetical protein
MIWINCTPFFGNATPRRSTSSLDEIMASTSNLVWDVVATFSDVPSAHAMVACFEGRVCRPRWLVTRRCWVRHAVARSAFRRSWHTERAG